MPWLSLKDVLEQPTVYGDISRSPIKYSPFDMKVNFPKDKTGWLQDQTLKSEKKQTYLPVLYDEQVYLVSCQTTEQRLYLDGIDGYKNAIVTLRKSARLFGNTLLRAEGVILDEETIGVLSQLPEEYRTIEGRVYWTAIKNCELKRNPPMENYGLYCITPSGEKHETLYDHGGRYGKQCYTVCAFFRPVIRLHPETCVAEVDDWKLDAPLEIKLIF